MASARSGAARLAARGRRVARRARAPAAVDASSASASSARHREAREIAGLEELEEAQRRRARRRAAASPSDACASSRGRLRAARRRRVARRAPPRSVSATMSAHSCERPSRACASAASSAWRARSSGVSARPRARRSERRDHGERPGPTRDRERPAPPGRDREARMSRCPRRPSATSATGSLNGRPPDVARCPRAARSRPHSPRPEEADERPEVRAAACRPRAGPRCALRTSARMRSSVSRTAAASARALRARSRCRPRPPRPSRRPRGSGGRRQGSSRSCRSPCGCATTSCRRASARSSGAHSSTSCALDEEVREDDDDGPPAQALADASQGERRGRCRGPRARRRPGRAPARRVCARPRAGGTNASTASVKSDEPDPVIAAERREREDAGDLDRLLALRRVAGAERAGRAHVDDEDDRELALLAVLLDEGAAGARRRVPVDRADVVAGLVFAELVEVHAAAAEARLDAALEASRC